VEEKISYYSYYIYYYHSITKAKKGGGASQARVRYSEISQGNYKRQ